MTEHNGAIDWQRVRKSLEHNQLALEAASSVDQKQLEETFHRRAVQFAERPIVHDSRRATLPLLVFSLDTELYGIELRYALGAFASPRCTPVPGGPSHLCGVASFDGEVCSVLDLRPLLGLPVAEEDPGPGCYAILIRSGDTRLALRVDSIETVRFIVPDRIAPVEVGRGGARQGLTRGVADDTILVLDADALLTAAGRPTV